MERSDFVENFKQLDIFYEPPKEDFMMYKKHNMDEETPSYNEVFDYFKHFTNWKCEIKDKKCEEIRPDFYDYRIECFCKILEITPEIDISNCNRKKQELEDDFYIMLHSYFGTEFMVKIVGNTIVICWEIPSESW